MPLTPRRYRLIQVYLHTVGLLNAWNMVSAFDDGSYLAGLICGLVMLYVAHVSNTIQRPERSDGA